MTRPRLALAGLLTGLVTFTVFLAGCPAAEQEPERSVVVLYSSVDRTFLEQAVAEFEEGYGIDVQIVGDTEATKTFGLVTRLLGERDDPRADVWWSSEPFGTIRLTQEGVLAPSELTGKEPALPADPDALHFNFAERARVICYHTSIDEADVPRTLAELIDPKYKDRVGMARPQFGTTRGHMAYLYDLWGEDLFRAWLEAMKNNGLKIYDGNATAVQAVRDRAIDFCLTDTDDVWAAQRNGWEVNLVYEATDDVAVPPSPGPLLLPNTAALVAGGPNPGEAEVLLDWIVSPALERLLAASDSRNIPVFPEVAAEFEDLAADGAPPANFNQIEAAIEPALAIVEEVLGN